MTNKQLVWNAHSAERLRRRGITRQMVRDVLAQGITAEVYTSPGHERRHAKRMYFGPHELQIVYMERATEIEFVTVEWLDYWRK